MTSSPTDSSEEQMKPFDGIRVVDFTHVLAGPSATYQLAVMGADVIKIEPLHEPDMYREIGNSAELAKEGRGTEFLSQNGNKRSLSLDLSAPDGVAVARRLIETADVMVENYRFGVMERHGLGYDAVSALNPRIIYCSLTGFGHTGPKARHPAYDVVIQAYSGLMAANGTPDSSPVRVGPAILDYGTGAHAALAISSALFQRSRTGLGQCIDVAMADAAMMLMSNLVVTTQSIGQTPPPPGNQHPSRAAYSAYPTADGMLMVGAYTLKQLQRLLRAIDRDDLAEEVANATAKEIGERRDEFAELLTDILATQTADEWEAHFNDAGVPAARVRRIDETLQHPQIQSRQVLQESDTIPETGLQLKAPVAAFNFAHGGPALTRPAPRLGEHSYQVLSEIGYSDDDISQLAASDTVYLEENTSTPK